MVGHQAILRSSPDGYRATTRRAHQLAGIVESVTIRCTAATLFGTPGMFGRTYQYSLVVVSPLMRPPRGQLHAASDLAGGHRPGRGRRPQKFLADVGLAEDLKTEWRLKGTYPKRAYIVQYEESDLAFVSRLLEADGIYHFLETGSDGTPTLVLADDSTAAKPIDGDPTLNKLLFHTKVDADGISEICEREAVTSGKFVLRDYNYLKPQVDHDGQTAASRTSDHTDLEIYDYPGGYLDPGDGTRVAKLRLEAAQAEIATLAIKGECVRISTGRKLDDRRGGLRRTATSSSRRPRHFEYTSAEVGHSGSEPGRRGRTGIPCATRSYFRRDREVPAAAMRHARGPSFSGAADRRQVVCPAGAQAEEIHTDENGCCKVKFNWDLGPAADDKATAWMRVSQLQTSGSMMLPRMGWEVVVEFLEGDPDQPIVTGRLYNGLFMPPYALPEGKTRTSIKTVSTPGGGGANEIRMEDKSGSEEMMIHSQKDTNVAVANNKTKNVGNNETLVVGADSSTTVGSNQTIKITKGSKNGITGNQNIIVGATRALEVNAVAAWNVTGNSTTAVGGGQMPADRQPPRGAHRAGRREGGGDREGRGGEGRCGGAGRRPGEDRPGARSGEGPRGQGGCDRRSHERRGQRRHGGSRRDGRQRRGNAAGGRRGVGDGRGRRGRRWRRERRRADSERLGCGRWSGRPGERAHGRRGGMLNSAIGSAIDSAA